MTDAEIQVLRRLAKQGDPVAAARLEAWEDKLRPRSIFDLSEIAQAFLAQLEKEEGPLLKPFFLHHPEQRQRQQFMVSCPRPPKPGADDRILRFRDVWLTARTYGRVQNGLREEVDVWVSDHCPHHPEFAPKLPRHVAL